MGMETLNNIASQGRVLVMIDGSNLYNKLSDPEIGATNLLRFDYTGFVDRLVGVEGTIIGRKYYCGVVRSQVGNLKGEEMRRSQQKLFSHLQNTGWDIERGFLMENNGRYHEKGVDVKIATDIVAGAYKNEFDTILLLSSDSDLIPAIKEAMIKGKRIGYVGFAHKPSIALVKNASTSRLLSKADVAPFVAQVLL
jgi:uncharacterized LabA/DUF88 family protein